MKRLNIRSLLALPLLFGCADELEPGAKVDSFRVLAEQADLPYARPGETVHLSSLSYDPAARPVTWAWLRCVNPSSSTLQGCLDTIAMTGDPAGALVSTGLGLDQVDIEVPVDALDSLAVEARGFAALGVVSVACPGDLSFAEGPGGLPFLCQEVGTGRRLELDEFIVGFKRIRVRESDRNQNPELTGVSFDGVDWPEGEIKQVGSCDTDGFDYKKCDGTDQHRLQARLSAGSVESGRDEQGHSFTEQVVIQYFATEGVFEHEIKIADDPQTGWVARRSASGQTLTFWFVVLDNRGGASWTQRQVQVR